jgi:GMC oxidoreductase
MTTVTSIGAEYDIVFIGGEMSDIAVQNTGSRVCNTMYNVGGACGGVAAGRLAAANPTLQILVLEVGPNVENDLRHTQPAAYLSHLLPTSETVRFHPAHPSKALGGRAVIVPTGQCVGGGSS